jgi:predicted RNA polymerase sigma factor
MAEAQATPPSPDWTVEVADRIESVVGAVRDRTTVPITKLARAVVFGIVAGVAALVALVLLVIAVVRLHVFLPFHPVGRQVWVVYAALSAIFLLAGMFTWRRRTPRKA